MDEEAVDFTTIYDIGSNHFGQNVLSLKANSRIVRDMSTSSDAFIEFTSTNSARIVVGTEEYELRFTDVKTTDAYEVDDANQSSHLEFIGSVAGRLQITNSKSGISSIEEELDHTDPTAKRRFISLLDTNEMPISGSQRSTEPPSKRAKSLSGSASKVPKAKHSLSCQPMIAGLEPAQPTLTSPVLLLTDVPVDVSASDILTSLFGGLSVSAIYVCSLPDTPPIVAGTGVVPETVDVYVVFSFLGGAELGLQRDGEELTYKAVDASNSSSSSAKTVKYTRRSLQPYIEPVEAELALWVRATGLRVSSLTEKLPGAQSLGPSSAFRKHIECFDSVLRSVENFTPVDSAASDGWALGLLADPAALQAHWTEVATQLMQPDGAIRAFSAEGDAQVRIVKDTKYFFTHPAVDDLLDPLSYTATPPSSSSTEDSRWEQPSSPLVKNDADTAGLYTLSQDCQHGRYEAFLQQAEAALRELLQRCSRLSALTPSSEGSHAAEVKYALDCLRRRVVMYKALYKEAWSLATTYCNFK